MGVSTAADVLVILCVLTSNRGTGVGLVKTDLPAADILKQVREETIKRIQHLQSFIPPKE